MWLTDTGAFVAMLDANDQHHQRVMSVFRSDCPALVTTIPVITETLHFVSGLADGPTRLLEFLSKTHTEIDGMAQRSDLEHAVSLMEKYADLPMDFADASLVVLAEKIGVRDILTTDERGFRVFRIHGRQAFHLVLDDFKA